jgi:hypothetical protein
MPAASKAQARFMRLVRKCQETDICLSDKIEKAAKSMTDKQAHYFAKTTDKQIEKKNKRKKRKKNESSAFPTFKNFMLMRESTGCTCPCVSCKKNKDCLKCSEKNCKHQGCNCH